MKKTLLPNIILAGLLLLLSGCGWLRTLPPSAQPVSPPSAPAEPTPGGAVPATQRPYTINGKTYYPLPSAVGFQEKGIASWYGDPFHGRKTSNGETYDMYEMTAAHKTLPMNTKLLVKNKENGKETVVRINDRGPFVRDRVIDLSLQAARKLDVVKNGTARVELVALGEAVSYQKKGKTYERFLSSQDFENGKFFVQIGAFLNLKNAERLKEKMEGQGRKTEIVTFDQGDNKIFYRVQVQAGTTLTGAKRMETVLSESGYPEAFVIAR